MRIKNSVTWDNFSITRQALWCRTVTLITEFSISTSQPLKILISCIEALIKASPTDADASLSSHFVMILNEEVCIWASSWENLFVPYVNNKDRSVCASAQSDQHLCCSLPWYIHTYSYCTQNYRTFSLCLIWSQTSENRFSCDMAQYFIKQCYECCKRKFVAVFRSLLHICKACLTCASLKPISVSIWTYKTRQILKTCYEYKNIYCILPNKHPCPYKWPPLLFQEG